MKFEDLTKLKTYGLRISVYRILHKFISTFHFHPIYEFKKFFVGSTMKQINGVKMHLDLKNDNGISKFLMIYGKREPVTVDYLLHSDVIREGDVVLDIGANIGYYALLESKMVGKSGVVYAVEPIKNNLRILTKNIHLNNVVNIRTRNLAIGDEDREKIKIYMRSKGNLSSLTALSSDYGDVVSIEEVPMLTVDTFIKKEQIVGLKFIRMDVEGYEANILNGMKTTLALKPSLQIEFHPTILTREQKDGLCQLLREYKYSKVIITINPKPRLNPVVRWLNTKIGENYHEEGKLLEGNIEYLHKLLFSSSRIFNAFIS